MAKIKTNLVREGFLWIPSTAPDFSGTIKAPWIIWDSICQECHSQWLTFIVAGQCVYGSIDGCLICEMVK